MYFPMSRDVVRSVLLRSAGCVLVACAAAMPAAGENPDVYYLPPPDAPATVGWRDCVRRCEPAIMLVGAPDGLATAFVISAKNRLLATNAHVADHFANAGSLTAYANGTTTTYTVDRVWCHPGLMRIHDGSLVVRCQDPSHGKVLPRCADVAVLHLAEGAELPAELTFATPAELNNLFAQPVALLGFPGCDQPRLPAAGEKPQASFREGSVVRLNPLNGSGGQDSGDFKEVQYSIPTWFGASGSPVFLPNGHVAAINEAIRHAQTGVYAQDEAYGIRIDCLWELLAYYDLTDQVPIPVNEASLNLARFRAADPEQSRCHAAVSLLGRCERLMLRGDFQSARENCEQALLLAPAYAKALRVRGNVLREFVGARSESFSSQQKLELLNQAADDLARYRKMAGDDPWGEIDQCWTTIWIQRVQTGNQYNEQVETRLSTLLQSGLLDPQQRACALFVRAAAAAYPLKYQADLDEAVRLVPDGLAGAVAYNSRGDFRQAHGWSDQADADYHRGRDLVKAEQLAATVEETLERPQATEDELRKAADTLLEACHLTNFGRWQHAFLMAFLQHRLGDDASATAWGTKALALAPDSRKAGIRTELASYSDALGRYARTTCYRGGQSTYRPEAMPYPVPLPGPVAASPAADRQSFREVLDIVN